MARNLTANGPESKGCQTADGAVGLSDGAVSGRSSGRDTVMWQLPQLSPIAWMAAA